MRRLVWSAIVVGGAVAGAAGAACGIDLTGALDVADADVNPADTGTPDRIGVDAADAQVAKCAAGQVLCGSACVKGDDCAACANAKLFCKPTRECVTSCASCRDLANASLPIECVACDMMQKNPIGSCEPNAPSTFCLSGNYATAHRGGAGRRCDCSGSDVANCPAGSQICEPVGGEDFCTTCGQAGVSTNGKRCKNGALCNASGSPPQCR